jgi:hypothetical protein
MIETADILCKECGHTGRMERDDGATFTSTFEDPHEAARLCKSPPSHQCPHWTQATREATENLRRPQIH